MANANSTAKNTQTSTYDLKVEKTIPKSPTEVFRAIGEGRLFQNCSADHESLKIDFKVGGKYWIEFGNHGMKNQGEFLEIVPYTKIAFTWCQDYDSNATPDTKVSIELKDLGGKTALTLIHTGFTDQENRDAHQGGWSGGLEDLSQEITNGKLRLMRKLPMSVEKLYATLQNPSSFFGIMGKANKDNVNFKVGGQYEVPTEKGIIKGEFLEITPNQKIAFSWKSSPCGEPLTRDTKVTLLLEVDDDDKNFSWIELLHEGLEKESQQKAHRAGWDTVLKHLK